METWICIRVFFLFSFIFIIITNQHTTPQRLDFVIYTATCFDTFLSPSDSLQPIPC